MEVISPLCEFPLFCELAVQRKNVGRELLQECREHPFGGLPSPHPGSRYLNAGSRIWRDILRSCQRWCCALGHRSLRESQHAASPPTGQGGVSPPKKGGRIQVYRKN